MNIFPRDNSQWSMLDIYTSMKNYLDPKLKRSIIIIWTNLLCEFIWREYWSVPLCWCGTFLCVSVVLCISETFSTPFICHYYWWWKMETTKRVWRLQVKWIELWSSPTCHFSSGNWRGVVLDQSLKPSTNTQSLILKIHPLWNFQDH